MSQSSPNPFRSIPSLPIPNHEAIENEKPTSRMLTTDLAGLSIGEPSKKAETGLGFRSIVLKNYDALLSGEHSDLKLVCGDKEFKVHQSIMCTGSPFFAAACSGGFLEAHKGQIDLKEDDVETVKRMILFLYTLDYDDHYKSYVQAANGSHYVPIKLFGPMTSSEKEIFHTRVKNNIAVYSIADKYGIENLKSLAKQKFNHLMRHHQFSHCGCFAPLLQQILETTPPERGRSAQDEGLWSIVARICVTYAGDIFKDEKCLSVISEMPDFGVDLLQKAMEIIADARNANANHLMEIHRLRVENERTKAQLDVMTDRMGVLKRNLNALAAHARRFPGAPTP